MLDKGNISSKHNFKLLTWMTRITLSRMRANKPRNSNGMMIPMTIIQGAVLALGSGQPTLSMRDKKSPGQ